MGAKTSISWTNATWNWLRGCSRVSQGCVNCYAEGVAARFSQPGQAYEGLAVMKAAGPRWTGRVEFVEKHILDPFRWRKPRMIFTNSMSDPFHEAVPFPWIDKAFAVMSQSPQHTFQMLTKRHEILLKYMTAADRPNRIDDAAADFGWCHANIDERWPLPNVWMGVSTEDQANADERVPALLNVPAAVRFLSVEPMLGPVVLRDEWLMGLHWVIAGAESGPRARPMNEDWVRSLRDQCAAAGVSFFYKQKLNEKGHKVETPALDGVAHKAFPSLAHPVAEREVSGLEREA